MRGLTRVRLVASLGLLLLPLAPAVAASGASGALVISGTGPGHADVTFDRPVGITPMLLGEGGWTWSGCGRIRGFYVQPLAGDPMAGTGAIDVAVLSYGRAAAEPLPATSFQRVPVPLGAAMLSLNDGQTRPDTTRVVLRKGAYRVHLLGEGRCRVRVPVTGLRGAVGVTTRHRSVMHLGVQTLDGPAGEALPGQPVVRTGSAAFPVRVTPGTFVLALLHEVTYSYGFGPNAAVSYEICVQAEPGQGCGRMGAVTFPGRSAAPPGGFYHNGSGAPPPHVDLPVETGTGATYLPITQTANHVAMWYPPGRLPPGEQLAKVVATGGPATSMQAMMFALRLT